jgi:signal transduction histidine kinase
VIFQQGYRRTLRELGDVRIAYERASALDDLKNQFIVSVNHELRNPVMAMMGHLDILDMSLASAPPERLQKATKGAIRAAENLRTLLASILDANRLEQGPGDFTSERVSLVQAIQASIQLIDPNEGSPQERELRILVPDDLSIWGEPIRLQQILTNLLSNALKYSSPGTPIEVTGQVVIETVLAPGWRKRAMPGMDRKLVEITVRDWGLGIQPEQIPLLFQRFVRLPRDLASNVVGNGLGLYVCRVCAEAMGGRIWVESSGVEGEGSAFHLRLPVPPAAVA